MKKTSYEEAKRWLIQAQDEFNDAELLRKLGRFYISLFHFQQAVEKAFKAFLYSKIESVEIFYTHSIDELSKMAIKIDPDFETVLNAKKLDRYYIQTRYPNGLPGGVPSRYFDDPVEAKEAMEIARKAISLIEAKMSKILENNKETIYE